MRNVSIKISNLRDASENVRKVPINTRLWEEFITFFPLEETSKKEQDDIVPLAGRKRQTFFIFLLIRYFRRLPLDFFSECLSPRVNIDKFQKTLITDHVSIPKHSYTSAYIVSSLNLGAVPSVRFRERGHRTRTYTGNIQYRELNELLKKKSFFAKHTITQINLNVVIRNKNNLERERRQFVLDFSLQINFSV